VELPKQRRPRSHFNQAVQAEPDERDGSGDDSSDDGNQTFGAVVGDGEIFELLAPANKVSTILSACSRHSSIIPEPTTYGRFRLSVIATA
jgi:hypothetical protein